MAKRKKQVLENLDYHEGLSTNQAKIILSEFGLAGKFDEFNDWMYGQTCPLIKRYNVRGELVDSPGIFEYDLFRWISHKKKGSFLVWD